MKKIFGVTILAILSLAAVFMFSCSDDSPTKAEGDLDDPEFEFMDDIFNAALTGAAEFSLELSMELSDSAASIGEIRKPRFNTFKAGKSEIEIVELEYTYNNFWHIYEVDVRYYDDDMADSIVFSGIDSLRFMSEGDPVQYPDELTDELQSRLHLNFGAYSDDESYLELAHHTHFDVFVAVSESVFLQVDGEAADSLEVYYNDGDSIVCDVAVNGSMDYNNIGYGLGMECPIAGSAAASVSVDMECESESENFNVNGTWTANWGFDDGDISVRVESGDTRWEYTDECDM